jgi:acyl-coenzyme A synthetase/AMP-(fatty) acid ligase
LTTNCVQLFLAQSRQHPDRPAIWEPSGATVSFAALAQQAAAVQAGLRAAGVGPGDEVLLFGRLGARLYAAVVAILAAGATVLFVEPWMPLPRIAHVVAARRPKAFVADWLGRLWGLRSAAIRAVPRWISLRSLATSGGADLDVEGVAAEQAGIITFTSGSTGRPKGVVRPHGYLDASLKILDGNLHISRHPGADLCIFANFTLVNLGLGKPTLLLGPDWSERTLRRVAALAGELAPSSLTCGPAFLTALLASGAAPRSLRNIHVGGALTDCALFEQAFAAWPEADVEHVYGSTEAEPVAVGSAREAVARSRAAGRHQALWIGRTIPEISARHESDGLWVAGPNVCPAYVMADDADARNKRRDAEGRLWHAMGDRLERDPDGSLWYAGRAAQPASIFALEQALYAAARSSAGFVHARPSGELVLVAERDEAWAEAARSYPEITQVVPVRRIHRDRRHRARIDRVATIAKEAPWLNP